MSSFYHVGDESNQLAPIPGYTVLGMHRRYATWSIVSDPTGIGAPGILADGVTNGPEVDNRFLSPAAPFEAFGGVRVTF